MTAYSFRDPAVRERRCCPRVEAYYSRSWNRYDMQPHFHDRVEIMYVLKGSCVIHLYDYRLDSSQQEITIDRHWTRRLSGGEFILLDRNVLHRLEVPDENYMLNLEFVLAEDPCAAFAVGDLASASPELTSLMDRGQSIMQGRDGSGELFRAMERVIRELSKAMPRDEALLQVMMAELLIRLADALKDSAIRQNALGYARKAADYIAAHLDEELRVAEVAREVGVAPAYLQRVFRQAMNLTMVEYLNRLRIERSKQLLMFTDEPIMDVAVAAGFNSRQHFFRVFNAQVGMSPQKFRQDQRARQPQRTFKLENAEDHWYEGNSGEELF